MIRISLAALLFVSIIVAPWWVSTIIALALVFVAEAYEVVLAGFFADLLFGAGVPFLFGVQLLTTLLFALLLVIAHHAKRRLLFYIE